MVDGEIWLTDDVNNLVSCTSSAHPIERCSANLISDYWFHSIHFSVRMITKKENKIPINSQIILHSLSIRLRMRCFSSERNDPQQYPELLVARHPATLFVLIPKSHRRRAAANQPMLSLCVALVGKNVDVVCSTMCEPVQLSIVATEHRSTWKNLHVKMNLRLKHAHLYCTSVLHRMSEKLPIHRFERNSFGNVVWSRNGVKFNSSGSIFILRYSFSTFVSLDTPKASHSAIIASASASAVFLNHLKPKTYLVCGAKHPNQLILRSQRD